MAEAREGRVKIVFLIWDYWPGLQGGAERQARLITRQLVLRGCKCEILTAWTCSQWLREDDDCGVRVRRLGRFVPALLKLRSRVERYLGGWSKSKGIPHTGLASQKGRLLFWSRAPFTWLARMDFIVEFLYLAWRRKVQCDLMHLHEPSWLSGVAQLAACWIGCRVVCQEATSPALPVIGYDTPFRNVWAWLRRKPFYIAMADYTLSQLLAKGIPRDRIFLLPNCVVVPPYPTRGMGTRQVLYVANFSQGAAWKAFDVLFDAWVRVVKQMPEARLWAVGGGDSSTWQQWLLDRDILHSVQFTGSVEDIENYFSQSAVLVLPSRVEGLSNALLEAQSWGLPCVVSDIPGNLAVIEDGVNGLVVPVGDSDKLAKALLRLLGDPDLRQRLGQAARVKIEAGYDIEKVTDRLMKIYKSFAAHSVR